MKQAVLPDYRDQIHKEFQRRKAANSRYSLRAYARDLELNPGFLSSILSGRADLSTPRAAHIAAKLGYGPEQTREFLNLLQVQKVSGVKGADGADTVDLQEGLTLHLDSFQIIADWCHYAILELACCKGFNPAPASIAKRLGITPAEAKQAVERLVKLGLLEPQGRTFRKTTAFIAAPTGKPSRALRSFHAQHLEKARVALEAQSQDRRDITGITVAVDTRNLIKAKEEIRRFRKRMGRLLSSGQPDRVYQLAIQLFELTDSQGERK